MRNPRQLRLPARPGIYAILNTLTGDHYIGSSRNIQARWATHQSALRRGKNHTPILQNAWNKYGEESFICVPREYVESVDDLIPREQYYIDTEHPVYNIRTIAERNTGVHPRPESIEKMRAKLVGREVSEETRERLRYAKQNTVITEEWHQHMIEAKANIPQSTRDKMSAAKKGKSPTVATEAAAEANRGKERPQAVKDKISVTKRMKAASGIDTYYSTFERDAKGRYTASQGISGSRSSLLQSGEVIVPSLWEQE